MDIVRHPNQGRAPLCQIFWWPIHTLSLQMHHQFQIGLASCSSTAALVRRGVNGCRRDKQLGKLQSETFRINLGRQSKRNNDKIENEDSVIEGAFELVRIHILVYRKLTSNILGTQSHFPPHNISKLLYLVLHVLYCLTRCCGVASSCSLRPEAFLPIRRK
jgi:hypothetical protein